jgi:hypothetical protein
MRIRIVTEGASNGESTLRFDIGASGTPPPSRRLSAPRHLPRYAGEEKRIAYPSDRGSTRVTRSPPSGDSDNVTAPP